jgi:cytoskeletal protein RodZ
MDEKRQPSVKKSAIYVDIEDDLTSIIGKVREAGGDVVALVPPKRVGVLQSAVNLKLLKKAAGTKKKLILITPDITLGTLAASAGIPVARSLNAEPKLLDTPEIDDSDEIINGLDKPIGELASKHRDGAEDKEVSAAVKAISDDDNISDDEIEDEQPKKKKPKIPNFSRFRKWLILGIVAGLALVAVLVWLIFFSVRATITISAKTSDEKIDQPISLTVDGRTDASKNQLGVTSAEPVKKTNQIEFVATGKKDVGDKATGKVTITNTMTPFNAYTGARNDVYLAAGTTLSSGNLQYALDADVTIAGSSDATVAITASNLGADYNLAGGLTLSVPGYATTIVYAVTTAGGITGGSRETITVVQQSDIDTITEKIKNDTDNNNVRSELTSRFAGDAIPIEDSFAVAFGDIKSAPAVGEKADKATATIEITYTMYGVTGNDVNQILMAAATAKLGNRENQMVFDDGFDGVKLLSFNKGDDKNQPTMRLVTTAKVGPKIDEDKIKEEAVGKKAHEISSNIEKIDGIENVKVDFFPFWISAGPSPDRIYIVKNGL